MSFSPQVQAEIRKKWHRFKLTRLHQYPKSRASNSTFATYLSRPRESNASISNYPEYRDRQRNGSFKGTRPLVGSGFGSGIGTISQIDSDHGNENNSQLQNNNRQYNQYNNSPSSSSRLDLGNTNSNVKGSGTGNRIGGSDGAFFDDEAEPMISMNTFTSHP